ncbi:helix-turn-helix domain-containing protein [Streptantibioticus cattleyicolor]|uniref:helix-turn-helix domain-containing protein n=1 Tax=Streptantibioticus cattleyicolor TaxID=29303 RepID=UPI000213F085|nr:helix-turn-helix transcriptional regulator [Streptantibioticus cattleyicolor]CCB71932.1 conserved protein of unknown function [Streptantibioticus cattleyicolor NRRL 8057 = DSM 46488]
MCVGPTPLSRFLRTHRRRAGLTQETLARRLDVSTRTVSNWERGRHGVDPDRVADLGHALGLTPDEHDRLRLLVPAAPDRAADPGPGPVRPVPPPHLVARFTDEWRRGFHDVAMPAYLRDPAWHILACNPAFTSAFATAAAMPHAMPWENFARFVCLHPDAPRVLHDWYDGWLVPVLGEIADGLRTGTDQAAPRRLLAELTGRPAVARAWTRVAAAARRAAPPPRRPLSHPDPRVGNVLVHVSSMEPEGLHGYRSVFWRLEPREPAPTRPGSRG